LVALDGTHYFASQAIHCHNCLTRQLSTGHTLYYHSAITPVVVCPGRSQVIALPPEYIMPPLGSAQITPRSARFRGPPLPWAPRRPPVVSGHTVDA
jgi:hypothetical protein